MNNDFGKAYDSAFKAFVSQSLNAILFTARDLPTLPADREYMMVCRSGARSGVAAWQLRAAGYSVSSLCGGLLAWQRAGCPVENHDN